MAQKQRIRISKPTKLAIIAFIKEQLSTEIWEEYTVDDLAFLLVERYNINYSKALDAIQGTQFIIELEEELVERRENGTLCDCIPLLSPYDTTFRALSYLSEVPNVVYKATPYTIMGLASIISIRLQTSVISSGIPDPVANYMRLSTNGVRQAILHVNMRYKCRFCQERYHVIHAVQLTNLLSSVIAHTEMTSVNDSHFVQINKD